MVSGWFFGITKALYLGIKNTYLNRKTKVYQVVKNAQKQRYKHQLHY